MAGAGKTFLRYGIISSRLSLKHDLSSLVIDHLEAGALASGIFIPTTRSKMNRNQSRFLPASLNKWRMRSHSFRQEFRTCMIGLSQMKKNPTVEDLYGHILGCFLFSTHLTNVTRRTNGEGSSSLV